LAEASTTWRRPTFRKRWGTSGKRRELRTKDGGALRNFREGDLDSWKRTRGEALGAAGAAFEIGKLLVPGGAGQKGAAATGRRGRPIKSARFARAGALRGGAGPRGRAGSPMGLEHAGQAGRGAQGPRRTRRAGAAFYAGVRGRRRILARTGGAPRSSSPRPAGGGKRRGHARRGAEKRKGRATGRRPGRRKENHQSSPEGRRGSAGGERGGGRRPRRRREAKQAKQGRRKGSRPPGRPNVTRTPRVKRWLQKSMEAKEELGARRRGHVGRAARGPAPASRARDCSPLFFSGRHRQLVAGQLLGQGVSELEAQAPRGRQPAQGGGPRPTRRGGRGAGTRRGKAEGGGSGGGHPFENGEGGNGQGRRQGNGEGRRKRRRKMGNEVAAASARGAGWGGGGGGGRGRGGLGGWARAGRLRKGRGGGGRRGHQGRVRPRGQGEQAPWKTNPRRGGSRNKRIPGGGADAGAGPTGNRGTSRSPVGMGKAGAEAGEEAAAGNGEGGGSRQGRGRKARRGRAGTRRKASGGGPARPRKAE